MSKFTTYRSTVVISFLLLASCGGNSGGGSMPPPPAIDTAAPQVSFSPNTLTVQSQQTGTSTLTATDNTGVASGPDTNCTNGGNFSNNVFTAPAVTANTTSVCTATAGDAAGNTGTATLTVTITPPPTSTISGKVTYDFVPLNGSNGLNYNGIAARPARGIVVQAVDSSGNVIESAQTDENGDYAIVVDQNIDVRMQALASLENDSAVKWDVSVTDNTNDGALYVLSGALTSSGTADSTRDLHASSGWGGSSYTGERAAAPFAILDTIYGAMTAITSFESDIDFEELEIHWSPLNRPEGGQFYDANFGPGEVGSTDFMDGKIGFSRFAPFRIPIGRGGRGFESFSNTALRRYGGYGAFSEGSKSKIWLLGAENLNTDEYDTYIVLREWAHHYADVVSQTTFMGWAYDDGDYLDPRMAFSEGLAKALAAEISGNPVLVDTHGNQQASATAINMEDNTVPNPGWYRDMSIGSIIYDIIDTIDDGPDTLSLGLEGIHNVLKSDDYPGGFQDTIFSFIHELQTQNPAIVPVVTSLKTAQNINGTGPDGAGETNDGGISLVLPLYKEIVIGPATSSQFNRVPTTEVCVTREVGEYNKLGSWAFLKFVVTSTNEYSVLLTEAAGNQVDNGLQIAEPYFNLLRDDLILDAGLTIEDKSNLYDSVSNLEPGNYILDVSSDYIFQQGNFGGQLRGGGRDHTLCFNASVNPTQ